MGNITQSGGHKSSNKRIYSKKNDASNKTSDFTTDYSINIVPTLALNLTNAILHKKDHTVMSDITEPVFDDYLQILPDEILLAILLQCDKYALSVVPKVCKQFYNMTVPDSYLWEKKCKIKQRRLISARFQQQRKTYKYLYLTQSRFNAFGNTQNSKNDHKAELEHMLIKFRGHEFTGEGKYMKFSNEYHARWVGTVDENYNVKIDEFYNHETYPYNYEGYLDPETGVIKGNYRKNNVEGTFLFTLTATANINDN